MTPAVWLPVWLRHNFFYNVEFKLNWQGLVQTKSYSESHRLILVVCCLSLGNSSDFRSCVCSVNVDV